MVNPVTPPSSTFDFSTMGFQYRDINGYVKYTWTEENGWNAGTMETDPLLNVHMCATGLNYGQQVSYSAEPLYFSIQLTHNNQFQSVSKV